MLNNQLKKQAINRGFTLTELMVAVSVFAVVVTLLLGSIISVFNANKKAKTLRTVMDNMSITLESMTREIRFGGVYHCGTTVPLTSPVDCGNPGNSNLTFRRVDGVLVTYSLASGRITKSLNGASAVAITSPDITITRLTFRVYGSAPYSSGGDTQQPQVIIALGGTVGTQATSASTFSLETTASQRIIDSQ